MASPISVFPSYRLPPKRPATATPDPQAWIDWRRAAADVEAQWLAEIQATVAAELKTYRAWAREQPASAFIRWSWGCYGEIQLPEDDAGPKIPKFPAGLPWFPDRTEPDAAAWKALAPQIEAAQALIAQRQAADQAHRAAEEAQAAEVACLRSERLEAEVMNAMDANAQGRWRLGLLPDTPQTARVGEPR